MAYAKTWVRIWYYRQIREYRKNEREQRYF